MLISLFGVLAAVLAAVGMYGVTSRAVSRRTREMGIRLALGASSANVTRLVVRFTLSGVAIGVALGVVGSILASRALAPFLFGIESTDRVAYAGSVALLSAVAVVASWLPARRAARVQPAVVLRSE
jgi:ABC-type antimicrobial peptide transport system permease subunit